jgi:hypothetical protein
MMDEVTARALAERLRWEHPDWEVSEGFLSPDEMRSIWESDPEVHERPLPDLLIMNIGWLVVASRPDGSFEVWQHMESYFDPKGSLTIDEGMHIRMGDARRTHIREALQFLPRDGGYSDTEREVLRAYLADRLGAFRDDTETLETVEWRDFGWVPTA